ncbi:hypothetical protein [Streptomyces specialis]|uniref:hypothetical protein n=1 Tax=Streptomyces specialis TaxID=498367 RepID=UPI00073EB222|nr:hypothetical protein [Streptomyces specialis]
MSYRSPRSGSAARVGRRTLIGAAALTVLLVVAGLIAHLTRDSRTSRDGADPQVRPASSSSPAESAPSPTSDSDNALPAPPSTRDPLVFGKAAAVALWSYDTRAHSRSELVTALHAWMTTENEYADAASVDALVPSPVLWSRMADNGQFATATADEAHFPASFTQALQADPEAITEAYVYAVTVSGKQSIGWNGSPQGGAEDRSVTLAVQCRPDKSCALSGALPNVAP